MKNHIVIKFLAVLLCAASLLGAVGSALGVFVLTEADLYDKTVDQIYEERIREAGNSLAHETASFYASRELGGCPLPMVQQHYSQINAFDAFNYGFQLVDTEGNVLMEQEMPSGDAYTTYSFAVSGQYMHFLDSVTASEHAAELIAQQAELEAQQPTAPGDTDSADAVLWDTIPAEGAAVAEIQISFFDSSHGASGDSLGTVFRNQDGIVVLRMHGWDFGMDAQDAAVTAITLIDTHAQLIYQAEHPDGVGYIQYLDDGTGDLLFQSFYASETTAAPAMARAVVTEPAVTEPTVFTEPVTEATEDPTVPVETEQETVPEETEAAEATEETAEPTEETVSETEGTSSTEATEMTDTAAETAAVTEPEVEAAAYKEDSEAEPTEAPTEPSVPEETLPEERSPLLINGKPLEEYQINRDSYWDSSIDEQVTAEYVYVPMPEMTLLLHLAPDALRYSSSYTVLEMVRQVRQYLLPALGICLLAFAVCAVYLCCAAGRKPRTDVVRAGGLNRIPLDLYGFAVFGGVVGLCVVIAEGGDYLLRQNVMVGCAFVAGMGYLAALLIVGFLFACVAQIKTPGGFWWRNSLVGWCLKLGLWVLKKLLRFCVWLEERAEAKGWPLLKGLFRWIWNVIRGICRWTWNLLVRIYHWMYNGFDRFLSLLPMTWQWLLVGFAMLIMVVMVFATNGEEFLVVLCLVACVTIILYGAHCFGTLMETTKKMNKGDLDSKVDDKLMIGAFKEFAGDLNDLAGVAVVAAQKQLKSERMKTELITNVSHDIKTPLTSIINYVDLLQKPHTGEQQEQYLEVLDRQSQRLKKLIDDLMDMSKASTGNMAVDITLVDAVESVNQALGEFADKLDRAQLIPVFRHTEPSVAMMADGRLVWRVLSNLLSNAVKYAMPGTRLYIDLMSLENKVVISLKNISRDELNVDAEELMERFVRGDDSRNTEGSGLGLNIAKSLMELQKGQLQLLVDGDLFKVTLIFPGL